MTGPPPGGPLWARVRRLAHWARTRLPPGLRTGLGVLFVLGGIMGFLPILGFWMIPLGLGLIWLDLAALAARIRRRRPGRGPGDTEE